MCQIHCPCCRVRSNPTPVGYFHRVPFKIIIIIIFDIIISVVVMMVIIIIIIIIIAVALLMLMLLSQPCWLRHGLRTRPQHHPSNIQPLTISTPKPPATRRPPATRKLSATLGPSAIRKLMNTNKNKVCPIKCQ